MSDPGLTLPSELDTSTAAELTGRLAALRGQDLVLDGSAVRRVGALGLQVLLSARATWTADAMTLTLADRSEALSAGLALAGLDVEFDRRA